MESISLAICDDHEMLIEGVSSLLRREKKYKISLTAQSGKELLEKLKDETIKIDILLLDINMPNMNGIEVCDQINQYYPHIKIIILTMHDERTFIAQLLRKGISSYILKSSGKNELINAIESISNGEKYFDINAGHAFMSSFLSAEQKNTYDFIPKITKREKETLILISKGLKNAEIAEKLFISINTVESHRSNLLSKLKAKNTASMVRIAIEKGLI